MNKKIVLLNFQIFLSLVVLSQTTDTVNYKLYYDFKRSDTIRHKIVSDSLIVEIGVNYSLCYSETTRIGEIRLAEYAKEILPLMENNRSLILDPPVKKLGSSQRMYKRFSKNDIIVYDNIAETEYIYNDSLNLFNWTIEQDTLTINNVLCQKAETDFRGRHFIAWYAPSIPISNGPLKFGGLPGLIISINDLDNFYKIVLTKIEKINTPFTFKLSTLKGTEISRKKMNELKKYYYEDRIGFLNSLSPGSINLTSPRSSIKLKYMSLEKE